MRRQPRARTLKNTLLLVLILTLYMDKRHPNKKILYIIPYFAPAWSYGGPVKVAYDFAKKLQELGWEVSVATTDVLNSRSRNNKQYEQIDGIRVFRFRNVNNKAARNLNLYSPIGLKKWLRQNINNYDVIHIHEFFTYQSIVASRLCKKLHKPYVIQPHGSLSQFCRRSRFGFIKNLIIKKFTPEAISCGAFIALNETEKRDIAKIYPQIKSKTKIVPNGLNLKEFEDTKPSNLHDRYTIKKESKIIAFIGRIHFKKGLDISFEALALLKDTLDFTFLIIGPDEGEKNVLEKLAEKLGIKDRIIFAGLMSGTKKLETLKGADLSLLNSRSEGLPTTLLESAALGLPIICSPGSNLPEVSLFKAGFVVSGAEQTAQKIKLVLADEKLRRSLSRNALRLSRHFDITSCAQKLNDVYRALL